MGFHVVLENKLGCDLDGRYAATEEDIRGAVIALAQETIFADGDIIRVIEASAIREPRT